MQSLTRRKFRPLYQPSKLLLGIIPNIDSTEFNILALCFTMTCSYDPPMIAISIEKKNFSYDLANNADYFVLSVPGESIAEGAMKCGILSGRNTDKFQVCGFSRQKLINTSVPGISEAIANIELKVENRLITGDHITLIGRVLDYNVNPDRIEKNLLAVGPNHQGYKLLIRKGIHRIAVVDGDIENYIENLNIDYLLSR